MPKLQLLLQIHMYKSAKIFYSTVLSQFHLINYGCRSRDPRSGIPWLENKRIQIFHLLIPSTTRSLPHWFKGYIGVIIRWLELWATTLLSKGTVKTTNVPKTSLFVIPWTNAGNYSRETISSNYPFIRDIRTNQQIFGLSKYTILYILSCEKNTSLQIILF